MDGPSSKWCEAKVAIIISSGEAKPERYSPAFLSIEATKSDQEDGDCKGGGASISWDAILPNDLLEKVLSLLPIVSIIRSSSVCKRWREAVRSGRCSTSPQKPWYFMCTGSDHRAAGYAYDPSLRKWYCFDFPCAERSNWSSSSSRGLLCLMDRESQSKIFVCNPVTKFRKRLPDAPGGESPDYSALAVAVDRWSHGYMVAVAKCKQVPQDFYQWDFSIHIYESETETWATTLREVIAGWRAGDDCVICDGILYFLIYSTGVRGNDEPKHCLVIYDLSVRSSPASIMRMAVPVPFSLTCGRLMNLQDRLVMVGGIGKHGRPGIIKGIGIWELHQKEWREIARMPHKFFQGFGEFDDVFTSSGADDLIYIQSFGSPALLTFDMSLKLWKWSVKSPLTKRFPLQVFTGFCFEPRLEITP